MPYRILGSIMVWVAILALQAASPVLDPTSFVAVGGCWTAGCSDSQLTAPYQSLSYPSMMARQIGTIMPLARFRPMHGPLIAGADSLPGVAPPVSQSALRVLPFPVFTFNPSIPDLTVAESLRRRPELPIQREGDLKQTLINLVLGYPALILDDPPRWSQIEYAERMRPTFLIWQPGEGDLFPAALRGDPSLATRLSSFATDLTEAAARLRSTHAVVLVLNLPDPFDGAFFSSPEEVAELYDLTVEELRSLFDLSEGDRITVTGLVEIGDFYRGRGPGQLSSAAVVKAPEVAALREALAGFNEAIEEAAARNGFLMFDLHRFVWLVRESGVEVEGRILSGRFGGGFYSPDGLFPSPTGHALLANELLAYLNHIFGSAYVPVDIGSVAELDPFLPKPADKSEGRIRRILPSDRGPALSPRGTP